jgi:hypothetical protein
MSGRCHEFNDRGQLHKDAPQLVSAPRMSAYRSMRRGAVALVRALACGSDEAVSGISWQPRRGVLPTTTSIGLANWP